MSTPTISVIIPTRDGPERLRECLLALSRQEYPRESWEVLVVDDGSSDRESVLAAFDPVRDQMDVHLIEQPHSGPATARNSGAARAKYDYLAFTDDDCLPHAQWLSELASRFELTPNVVLGGRVVNGASAYPCSEASQQLVAFVVDYFLNTQSAFFPSNNLALPRAAFDAIGGFDARFPLAAGEDRDLCAKCSGTGIELVAAPDAVVEHRHALRFGAFLRKHFNYGRGAFLCRRLAADRGAEEFQVEPIKFYLNLVRAPFREKELSSGRLRVSALLFLSQAANAAGFFGERFGIGDSSNVSGESADSE